jgi:hypothetical protein
LLSLRRHADRRPAVSQHRPRRIIIPRNGRVAMLNVVANERDNVHSLMDSDCALVSVVT